MANKQNLTKELYFYLIQHHFLYLPGIGDFTLIRISASIDSENRSLLPPSYAIQFTPSESGSHRDLFSYLAEKLNVTEVDAIMMVNDYAMELKYLLQLDGFAAIEFIGKLNINEFGKISLDAQPLNVNFLTQLVPDSVNVENIITVNPEEEDEDEENEENQEEFAAIEVEESESSKWKLSVLILVGVAIFIFVLSRISGNSTPLMGLQNTIEVKSPLTQHN